MSSFKKIGQGIDNSRYIYESDLDDPDVISLTDDPDVLKIKNTRFRKFRLDLPEYDSQDLIYHFLFDLRECRKIRIKTKGAYYEIKPHKCHLECKDSGGLKCDGKCGYGVH